MIKLPRLKRGDKVDVIAPGYGASKRTLERAEKWLNGLGLEAVIPDDLVADELLCSNIDEYREKHFLGALKSDSKAIWCLKGGYGAGRLIQNLEKADVAGTLPKWFIGYSDNSVLHSWLHHKLRWPTVHGPVLWELAHQHTETASIEKLEKLLLGGIDELDYPLDAMNDAAKANPKAEGVLVGGNLTLIQHLLKTPIEIQTDNAILLIEEIDEAPYSVDRILTHLALAGVFDNVSAVLFGNFTKNKVDYDEAMLEKIMQRFADNLTVPVFKTNVIGHSTRNDPVLLNTHSVIENNILKTKLANVITP